MAMRSWLFVPGDSESKLAKVASAGADITIVDLEDAVAPEAKERARHLAAEWLAESRNAHGAPEPAGSGGAAARWVRINPLDGDLWRADLAAIIAGAPAGIMVPKAAGPAQLGLLTDELDVLEPRHGIAPGATRILPLVSETPTAALTIATYANAAAVPTSTRLIGLTWGAEDLSAAIGATRKRGSDGAWTDLFRMVRSTVLLTAHAAGVAAIDTLQADFRDLAGLDRAAHAAYADGFHGMLAIHPAQVPVINAAFTPTAEQIAEARAIVAAFAAEGQAGALQLEGRMIDRPHLEQAKRLLAGER